MEIEVRGRRKDTKEWVTGGYYKCKDGKEYIVGECRTFYEVDSESVGIYTGEEFKGLKVYNGDVFKYRLFEEKEEPVVTGFFKVVYMHGAFFAEDFKGGRETLKYELDYSSEYEELELVGHVSDGGNREWQRS